MRIFLIILTLLWLTFWLVIGIGIFSDTSTQIISDKNFIENKIKPSVDFVKKFQIQYERLPTYREFYTWERGFYKDYSSDLTQKVDSLISSFSTSNYIRSFSSIIPDTDIDKFKNANWSKDFAIGVWRGEWMEYYFSWSDTYDTNNYSWKDGYISLFKFCVIGLLPLLFWFLYWIKNKKLHITKQIKQNF